MSSVTRGETGRYRRRPRTLHVVDALDRGSASEAVIRFCLSLASTGWEVDLAHGPATEPAPGLDRLRREKRIGLIELPSLVPSIRPRSDIRGAAKIRNLIRRSRYDLIHTHAGKAGLLGRWAARGAGAAIVHTSRARLLVDELSPGMRQLLLAAERRAARWCDRIVVLTESGRLEHLKLAVGRPDQLATIHGGVSLEGVETASGSRHAARSRFGFGPGDFVVGCLAPLEPSGVQTQLLRAAWHLQELMPSLRVLLVREGEGRRELETFALNRFIRRSVIFGGSVDDPREMLAAMDLCAVTPPAEEEGGDAIRSMAAGVPVVAWEVGDLRRILDGGRAGLLVPAADSRALSRGIRILAEDPGRRSSMARAGLEQAGSYSVEEMCRRLHHLYGELLESRECPPWIEP